MRRAILVFACLGLVAACGDLLALDDDDGAPPPAATSAADAASESSVAFGEGGPGAENTDAASSCSTFTDPFNDGWTPTTHGWQVRQNGGKVAIEQNALRFEGRVVNGLTPPVTSFLSHELGASCGLKLRTGISVSKTGATIADVTFLVIRGKAKDMRFVYQAERARIVVDSKEIASGAFVPGIRQVGVNIATDGAISVTLDGNPVPLNPGTVEDLAPRSIDVGIVDAKLVAGIEAQLTVDVDAFATDP